MPIPWSGHFDKHEAETGTANVTYNETIKPTLMECGNGMAPN